MEETPPSALLQRGIGQHFYSNGTHYGESRDTALDARDSCAMQEQVED